ncbi:PilZ domain-containing protein [Zooshikella ganghwensis]|uniref:PilZ domain-containing protein n=1 Tax=Zooshikella ganghwensis TaxID=202772 RepID=A0A4P9VJP6_9GAMM|nr:PilZ domain-containing protein [Zooshikella ganghwensis]RDH42856.1 PilZ domain-containing protein [Zooshikella ganghwensis]
MSEDQGIEQRRHPRRGIKWKVLIRDKAKEVVVGRTVNVSVSGALIEVSHKYNINEAVDIQIAAVYLGKKIKILSRAVVRHTVVRTSDFQIGIEFNGLKPEMAQFLDDFASGVI